MVGIVPTYSFKEMTMVLLDKIGASIYFILLHLLYFLAVWSIMGISSSLIYLFFDGVVVSKYAILAIALPSSITYSLAVAVWRYPKYKYQPRQIFSILLINVVIVGMICLY